MNKWISIKDRLPERYKRVLVLTKFNMHFEAHHHGEEIPEWEDNNCVPLDDITHWMPLPNPPKES